jgi:hypothetical protein
MEMIGKNIGNEEIDLIAVQLLEETRMDMNDIPYADEYKEQDPWKNKTSIWH